MWEVGAAGAVFDVPVIQPLLEHTTCHLGSSISRDVFWYVPCGTKFSQYGDLVLAAELAREGGHHGAQSREPVGYNQEVVAMEIEVVSHQHLEWVVIGSKKTTRSTAGMPRSQVPEVDGLHAAVPRCSQHTGLPD